MLTLETVKAEQARLAGMIAKLEATAPKLLTMPAVEIELRTGERYVGLVLTDSGACGHHLILLPGEAESVTWQGAQEWAAANGGELPTRQEQALLYANAKSEFKPAWYWSSEPHENDASAWIQTFGHGSQYHVSRSSEERARAVRRFSV